MYVVAHNGSAILGGGELGTVFLLAGLQARGHRVKMLLRDESMAERVASYGIPTGTLHVGGDVMLPHALRVAAALRRERPDALILTTFKKVVLTGLGARLARVPLVIQRIVLETDSPARGRRYRVALRRFVDRIALNAGAMRDPFLAADPALDPAKVVTVYDGVRTPERVREPGALRRELGVPEGARTIGALARLARQKRFDRLLHALARLPDDVHCVLAGEGEKRDELLALASELGVAHRLHLAGFRRDVGDVLDAVDVFVVSSDREGMANAMLEAMAFGVPVVSTDVSGAREALAPLADGRVPGVVVDRSVDGLVGGLRPLLDDVALRRSAGEAARERVREVFSFEAHLDRWEAVLGAGR